MRDKGFTLMEVLIALLIVSLAYFSCLFTLNQLTKSLTHVKEKTVAQIIASNVLTQVRLQIETNLQGSMNMSNQTWHWELHENKTNDKYVNELFVMVKNDHNTKIYKMKGYRYAQSK